MMGWAGKIARRAETCPTIDATSDVDLIERIGRGDQSALKSLMTRYQIRIFRFALRFVSDRELAEEAVRETFFTVWRNASRFEHRSSASTWLLGIARNKALTARDRVRLSAEHLSDELAEVLIDPYDLPDAVMERQQSQAQVRNCLSQLPAQDGELFDLVYYHEKSMAEVALITNVPINTVKSRMLRARRRLAALLAAADENAFGAMSDKGRSADFGSLLTTAQKPMAIS